MYLLFIYFILVIQYQFYLHFLDTGIYILVVNSSAKIQRVQIVHIFLFLSKNEQNPGNNLLSIHYHMKLCETKSNTTHNRINYHI